MIVKNVIHSNPLYQKKRVIVTRKIEDNSQLSISQSNLEDLPSEKVISLNESVCSILEKPKPPEVSQYEIDQILRSYGSSLHFKMMIQSLLTKRSKEPFIRGKFKPEVYEKDFYYYYNLHRLTLILRKGAKKKPFYPKSAKNMTHCTIDFYNPNCIMDSTFEKKNSSGEKPIKRSITANKVNEANKYLTQIPFKSEDADCKRLEFAYSKAKDAARVVRRLEYSYNMKINCQYNKPIHKLSAKIIQAWWRKIQLDRFRTPFVMKIQKRFRGILSRIAFKHSYYFTKSLLVLFTIHDKASQKLCKIAFEELLFKYGLKTINRLVIPKANLAIRRIKSYLLHRWPEIPKIYQMQCLRSKFILDCNCFHKLHKLQGRIRVYLMKRSGKIMLSFARKVHPYLFYYLKYGTKKYKKKLVEFRRCYRQLREFNLKVNKGLDNRFELLSYLLRKVYWKLFKEYDAESKKRDRFKPIKKRILRKTIKRNDKENLQNALEYWRIYKDVHKKFIRPHTETRVKMLTQTLQSHKNMFETIFLNQLRGKVVNRPTKKEAVRRALVIKHDKTPSDGTYLNKYFQMWRNIIQKILMFKSSKKMNRFLNDTKRKYKQNKAIKHFFLSNLVKTGLFYKNSSIIQFKLKRNIYRHAYTKIRSITFKEHMESFLRSMFLFPKVRFHQWSFETKKFKYAMVDYITFIKARVLGHKRHLKLKSIKENLSRRLKLHHLRRAFIKYRINAGIYFRYPQCFNFQMLFIHKKKKVISKKRYRLLRYTINKITTDQEDLRINSLLIAKWDKWKKTLTQMLQQKTLTRFLSKLSIRQMQILKMSMTVYRKKIKALSIKRKVLTLQKNYKVFADKKVGKREAQEKVASKAVVKQIEKKKVVYKSPK